MPSAHTAFVVSLATTVALNEGIQSADFAIAVIFALLIIRDAIGLRQFLGLHGKILNVLLHEHKQDEARYPKLVERLGHTPLQATVGGLIGLIMALGMYQWLS